MCFVVYFKSPVCHNFNYLEYFVNSHISCFILVSSWRLGQRSKQQRGPCEAWRSGQGGQCDALTDWVLPETSVQEAQEEGTGYSQMSYKDVFVCVYICVSFFSLIVIISLLSLSEFTSWHQRINHRHHQIHVGERICQGMCVFVNCVFNHFSPFIKLHFNQLYATLYPGKWCLSADGHR